MTNVHRPSPTCRARQKRHGDAGGRRPLRAVLARWGAAAALTLSGCGLTSPLYVESKFVPAEPPPATIALQVAPVVDARRFTSASNRAPVPSVQGDPADTALTARTIGRRPTGNLSQLGANVTLPPGRTVAAFVEEAVIDGLRRAGVDAAAASTDTPSGTPRLTATLLSFWLDVKPMRGGLAVIEYRAEVELSGDWPRFRDGRSVETRGTVSAGGLDNNLWRRTFDRALDEIASQTARAADPSGASR